MADKDFVIKHGLVVGDTATINGVQIDPSGATSGKVLKFDGTKFTPASEGDISGTVYSTTIGDGTNSSYTITHGFGTRNVLVVIRNAASPYEVINARWEATTTNTITVDFSSPVTSDSIIVSVYGAVTGVSTGSSYYQTIGNGTDSSFTLTHNFNTRDVVVTARNAASPYEVISARWEAETANTVVLDFSVAPSSDSVRVGVYATVSGTAVTTIDDLGDVTITSVATKDFLKWNGTAWVNDAIDLGSDTTGNYVASLIAGTNIIISNNSGEGATPTISVSGSVSGVDSISNIDFVQFDTTANTTPVTGLLGWDSVEGTLNLGLSAGKHIHVGEESVFRVRNSTGVVIGKGTALYASGVEPSGRIQVTPYVADGSVREVRFMGLATESINNGVNGFVQHFGYVRDLDTRGTSSTAISVGDETWAAGDILYVHPTVPGKLTNVAPRHAIIVALLIIRHATTGVLFVRPSSGGHIEDIHNVVLTSPTDGQFLRYDSTSAVWVNDTINLGTDTTGNYVSSLVAGTGITLSNNSGEGATPTVSLNASLDNLTDVSAATPSFGEVLQWNGSAWVPSLVVGPPGADGSDGADGAPGIPGEAGMAGAAGAAGEPGPPGADGADGSDGADGDDGADGLGYPALQTPATQYYDTSTTFGSTTFTLNILGTAYIVGNRVRLIWNTNPNTYFEGTITSYDSPSTTLYVDVDLAVGASGAKDVFNLALTGEPGPLETVGFSFSSNTVNSTNVAVTSVTVDSYGRVTAVSANGYQYADASNAGVVRIDENDFLMDAGTLSIKTGAIYNGDINASAGIALSKLATGTAGNVLVYNGSGVLTSTGSPAAATTSTGTSGFGYMGLPQNGATTGAYGVVAADAGTHIYSSATRTVTLPANGTIAMPIGSTVVFIAGPGATVTIAITSDTMYLAGLGTTGSRTLAPFGMATAVKITSTSWIISGNGLT